MNDKAFLDTNILVYLYSTDEAYKRATAEQIMEGGEIILSTQVINEFVNVMIKKYRLEIAMVANAVQEIVHNFSVTQITTNTVMQALSVMRNYRLSYFDSLIVASALENNCSILYTEDLHHTQLIEKRVSETIRSQSSETSFILWDVIKTESARSLDWAKIKFKTRRYQ